MTGDERRLVALVAVLAPGRAARLLAHLGGRSADRMRHAALALAVEPRRNRLAALAASLAEAPTPAAGHVRPLLRRLAVESLLAGSAGRTPVRGTAAGLVADP
jgi:hypothetical protein